MSRWIKGFNMGKTSKPLKKLWVEFLQNFTSEKGWTVQKQKSLLLFLDAFDSYKDQPISVIFEELDQNHEEIFATLFESADLYLRSYLRDKDKYDEESLPSLDFLQKILYFCEILLNSESKLEIRKCFEIKQGLSRNIVSILSISYDKNVILVVLKIIKRLIINVHILKIFIKDSVLDGLMGVFTKFQDHTLMQQTVYLLTLIVGNNRFGDQTGDKYESNGIQRTRTFSTSSMGSVAAAARNNAARKPVRPSNQSPQVGRNFEIVDNDQKIPVSSFSYAWSVFSELMKYAPIAGTWLGPKDEKMMDDTGGRLDEVISTEAHLFFLNLALTPEEIEIEKLRLLHSTQDDQSIGEKVTENSKESDLGQFLESNCLNLQSLVLAVSKIAVTPADGISVLTFASVITIKQPKLQESLLATDGLNAFFDMIIRIELNLPLLCHDNTKSLKTKSDFGSSSSNHGQPNSALGDKGKFYSFAGSDFDTYYTELVVLLAKLLVDEEFVESSTLSPFVRTWSVKNFSLLGMVKRLIESPYQSLVAVGLRACLMIIRLNPQNCVLLESQGILQSLFTCGIKLAYFGRIDYPPILADDENRSSFHSGNALENSCLDLFEEISFVLQLASICFSRRDSSILAAFAFLLLSLWVSFTQDHSVHRFARCMNCESEFACFECISEGCVRDHYFRLCRDCDIVFHKSAIKRRHIRVPVAQDRKSVV